MEKPALEFGNKTNKIKHIQYSPHNENQFAAACDGIVKVYDIRNPRTEIYYYQPSGGELAFLDWHPTVPGILLTGGTSCNIVAQNIKHDSMVFNIQTADPVSKCTWIPNR